MHGKIKSTEFVGTDEFSLRRFRETIIDQEGRRYEKSIPKMIKKLTPKN